MPNQLTVLRDTSLLSDRNAVSAQITDATGALDGSASITILTTMPLETGEQARFETIFNVDINGQLATTAPTELPLFTLPSPTQLSGGNAVTIDNSGDAIVLTTFGPDGTELSSEAIDMTEIAFPDEAIVALSTGGFAATWLDSDDDSFAGDVALQFFDEDGVAATDRITPNLGDGIATGREDEQRIVETPSGEIGVFWLDTEGSESTIKYAAYDETGNELVSETDLGLTHDREAPLISYRSDGSFLVISETGQANVFAADGTPLGAGTTIDTGGGEIVAAGLQGDGFAIATSELTFDTDGDFAGYLNVVRVFGDDGVEIGTPVPFAELTRADGSNPIVREARIVTLEDGAFALAWQQSGDFLGSTDPILVKVFSTSGEDVTANRAPVITTPTAISIDENSTDPVIIAARDLDGDTLTFAIAPSDDAALFDIDAATGALSFVSPQDFEAPSDLDEDATYAVEIEVSDGQSSLIVPHDITLQNIPETETGGPQASDYDAVFTFGTGDDTLFPAFFIDDFPAALTTNDFIDLGDGNDAVRAGDGDDYIIAGPGQDFQISGGAGRDVFRFGLGDEFVRIRDFTQGEDLIFLADGLTLDDLTVQTVAQSDGGTGTRLTTAQGDRLVIDNLALDLSPTDLLTDDSALPRNFAPIVSTFLGSGSFPENASFAGSPLFSDPNEDALSLDIALSGPDGALFAYQPPETSQFGSARGTVNFITPPDFEEPADADGDNIYEYTITATDSGGLSTSEDVQIALTDLDDGIPPGEAFDTVLRGDDGNNRLSGTNGRDHIIGEAGNDLIRAAGGDDLIDAGAGLDYRVYGGGGSDLFLFEAGNERIRVLDFNFGQDKILLGEGIVFEDVTIREWQSVRLLDDGSFVNFGGINVILANEAGLDDRFSIALGDLSINDVELTVDDFVLSRDVTLPETDEIF